MKSRGCGGLVKRLFVRQGGAGSSAGLGLTESPVRLSQALGSSRWDQLQRQQTLGKGKGGDWQLGRKTKAPGPRAPFWGERCAEQDSKGSQHWGFYCVGDDWTGNVNSGRQLLRCWCFREMLSKYYRPGEWPHRGDCMVSLSIMLNKQNRKPTHTLPYLPLSLACKEPRGIRRFFQRVSRSKSLLTDSTYMDFAWL